MLYHNEFIHLSGTVVCDEWENAVAFMKSLIDISNEKDSLGEYAICVTREDGIRIDFKWIAYDAEDIVFCSDLELEEIIQDSILNNNSLEKALENDIDDEVRSDI